MMEKVKKRLPLIGMLSPVSLLFVIIFFIPFAYLAVYSFWGFVPGSFLPDKHLTLENYNRVITDPEFYYLRTYVRTIRMSLISTAITLVLAYPLARFIAQQKPGAKGFYLVLAMLPMLGGAMIQTLGWVAMLHRGGVINGALKSLGLIDQSIQFMGKELGVIITLVQAFLPVMVIPLVAALGKISPSMEEAAKSLGANSRQVFFQVILPLSLPGAIAGTILVLMANLTMFVSPSLIGQGKIQVFGTFAYQTAVYLMHWPFASAYAIIFLSMMGIIALLLQMGLKAISRRAMGENT